jgi:hypothetical protein
MTETPNRVEHVFAGGVLVTFAPPGSPPYEVDAVIEEEDRHLVLSAPPVIPERTEHPIRVMTDLLEAEPLPLGSVVVRGETRPRRLLAIVHDLNLDPSATRESVALALSNVGTELERLSVRRARFPLLGAVHGVLDPRDSASLIRAQLVDRPPKGLEHVWIVPLGNLDRLLSAF